MLHKLNKIITGQNTGKQAEDAAATFCKNQGLTIVETNFLCKGGEIDIIAKSKNTLIFIEVRFRKSQSFGGGAASVSQAKQKKVIHAAQIFLQQNSKFNRFTCRFDVIALAPDVLQWIPHAFEVYS